MPDTVTVTLELLAAQAALVAFLAATLSVPIVRRVAIHMGFVDIPSARKVHTEQTPMLGGAAVLIGFLAGLAVARYFGLVGVLSGTSAPLRGIVAGAVVIFLMGVVDDKFGLSPTWKFAGQGLVALILIAHEVRLHVFIRDNLLTTLITLVWLVGIINSFNLMDNMNGLSSGVALIAAASFGLIAYEQENIFVLGLCAALAGSLAGFLPHNFPRARIFMGDGGSMMIGFVLAAVSVQGVYLFKTRLTHLPIITPVIVLGVPLFDTFSVMAIRRMRGLPLFKADKNHFSHRLVDLGMTQVQAVLLIYLVAIAVSIPAVLLSRVTVGDAIMMLVQVVILFIVIVELMRVGMTARAREPENGG